MSPILYIIFGLLVGAVVGWLLHLLRSPRGDARVEEELRAQRATQEAELASCARSSIK